MSFDLINHNEDGLIWLERSGCSGFRLRATAFKQALSAVHMTNTRCITGECHGEWCCSPLSHSHTYSRKINAIFAIDRRMPLLQGVRFHGLECLLHDTRMHSKPISMCDFKMTIQYGHLFFALIQFVTRSVFLAEHYTRHRPHVYECLLNKIRYDVYSQFALHASLGDSALVVVWLIPIGV